MARFYVILSLLLLQCTLYENTYAETDFKHELGVKFGKELKTLTIQFSKTLTTELIDFYELMLQQLETTEEEGEAYTESLTKLKGIKKALASDDKQKIIETIKELNTIELRKFASINAKSRSTKVGVLKQEVDKTVEKISAALKVYLKGIREAWNDDLEEIPEEERVKEPKYADISLYIDRMYFEWDDRNQFTRAMRKVIEFFDYKDWEVLLEFK